MISASGGDESPKVPIDWRADRRLLRSIEDEIAAYNQGSYAVGSAEEEAKHGDEDDPVGRNTATALEKITLRDEIAMIDLKLAALALSSEDEIKAAQDEIRGQNKQIEAVLQVLRPGLDRLRSDLGLIRSLRAADVAGTPSAFLKDLAAQNRQFRQDLGDYDKAQRRYRQLAEQVKKQPKNDELASKAAAAGRKRRKQQAQIEKSYTSVLEKSEQRVLAAMVDFTEYSEYLGRLKDRYNRDVGFLIVYQPLAEAQAPAARKQLLENREELLSKLSQSSLELSDDDEVVFFRRQILGRLLGQAPKEAIGQTSTLPAVPEEKQAQQSAPASAPAPAPTAPPPANSGFTIH